MKANSSNQSMKPTAPFRNKFSVFATTPCRGLSLGLVRSYGPFLHTFINCYEEFCDSDGADCIIGR